MAKQGIYKRGRKWWISYAGIDGKIKREPSGSERYKEAEALLIKCKQAIADGKEPEAKKRIGNFTFNQLMEEYLKWCERQRSFLSKQRYIKQLLVAFSNLPLRRLNTMLIEQWQTARLNGGNKPATVNRLLATLKHAIGKGVEWDMVEEEILKRVRRVKLLEENNRRLRYLNIEECQTLLSNCSPHLRPVVVTALNTGMRKSEILKLTWDRVDLRNGFVLLDITKNGERREIPIDELPFVISYKDFCDAWTHRMCFTTRTTETPSKTSRRASWRLVQALRDKGFQVPRPAAYIRKPLGYAGRRYCHCKGASGT